MNIRMALYALMVVFGFQIVAMEQEHVMALIQQGSEYQIREFAQAQCPTDVSFIGNGITDITFAAVAALLIQDKIETIPGKIVAGTLGFFVVAKGISFIGGTLNYFIQKAQQEKLFQYFMNIRKGIEMRKQALNEDDSEDSDE